MKKYVECEKCHRPMVVAKHAFWYIKDPMYTETCYYCNYRRMPGKPARKLEGTEGHLLLLQDAYGVWNKRGNRPIKEIEDLMAAVSSIMPIAPNVPPPD